MFKVFDVSMPITPGMTVWKDQEAKRPSFTVTRDFSVGPDGQRTGVHEMRLCLDSHTGTHVDAPLHMLPNGAPLESSTYATSADRTGSAASPPGAAGAPSTASAPSAAARRWVGQGWVLDLTELPVGNMIGPAHLDTALARLHASLDSIRDTYLFLKTVNSRRRADDPFEPRFVALGAPAARHLVELGVRGVGIDALGIERDQPGHPTHQALLGSGVVIIEGLLLDEVPAGQYLAVVAPLRLLDTDAAPARVLLLGEQS